MDVRQSPFSLYDFLGYLIPGGVFLYVFEYFLKYIGVGVDLVELSELRGVNNAVAFVVFSYILGHVISLLSSFTVERYYIWKFGYPSKTLLRWSVRPMYEDIGRVSLLNAVKMACGIIIAPVAICSNILCFLAPGRPGMVQALDPLLTQVISSKITRIIHEKGQVDNPNKYAGPLSSDFFRFVYHFAVENCPGHSGKLSNYVALFGFSRSISFIFCIIFWLSFVSFLFTFSVESLRCVLISFFLSSIFFFGFAKFYRRYSLEALMAVAVTYLASDDVLRMNFPKVSVKDRVRVRSPKVGPSIFEKVGGGFRSRIRFHSKWKVDGARNPDEEK